MVVVVRQLVLVMLFIDRFGLHNRDVSDVLVNRKVGLNEGLFDANIRLNGGVQIGEGFWELLKELYETLSSRWHFHICYQY